MDTLTQSLITLLISLVSGAFVAWITVKLSLRSFYAEKWWERKIDAYTALIESFYNMLNYWYEEEANSFGLSKLNDSQTEVLKVRYERAIEQIDKATDIGAFVIANEASKVLEKYRQSRWDLKKEINITIHSPFDMAEMQVNLTRNCLQSILNIAKRDLGRSKGSGEGLGIIRGFLNKQ